MLALIALGFALRQLQFLDRSIWAGIEKLAYFVLFPALLVHSLAVQDVSDVPWAGILAIIVIALVSSAALLVFWYGL